MKNQVVWFFFTACCISFQFLPERICNRSYNTWSEGPLWGDIEGWETSIGACEVANKVLVEECLMETAQEICRKSGFLNAAARRRAFSFRSTIYYGL